MISPGAAPPGWGRWLRADLGVPGALETLCRRERPAIVVHTAAIASVALAHAQPALALRINVEASAELARAAAEIGARLVYVSTDMVFDGERAPYAESAPAQPGSVYGRTKRDGELAVLGACAALVVRLPLMYGLPALPRPNTFAAQVRALRDQQPLQLYHDEFRTPLWLDDGADALIRCARSQLTGLLHVGGPERLSRLDMGVQLAEALGAPPACLVSSSRNAQPAAEPRARDLSLDSSRYRDTFGAEAGRTLREALRAMRSQGAL